MFVGCARVKFESGKAMAELATVTEKEIANAEVATESVLVSG